MSRVPCGMGNRGEGIDTSSFYSSMIGKGQVEGEGVGGPMDCWIEAGQGGMMRAAIQG